MNKGIKQSALLGGFACAVIGASPAVNAQDSQNSGIMLDRVVVTAGKEKIAIDTPQAVSVVDQEDIDEKQGNTVGEVLKELPGVTVVGSDRVLGQSFNIRGIGSLGSADEPRLIVTVDGATKFYEQYRMGSFFSEPELYKRIEVLRGPASSTLYGSGALAGVINLTTKDASDFLVSGDKWALRVKGGYASNGNGKLGSVIGAYKFSDSFEVLASINKRTSGNFEDGSGNTIIGSEFEAYSGLLKGTYTFGANRDQKLTASYQQWSSDADDAQYSQTGTLADFGRVDRKVLDKTAVIKYEHLGYANPWLNLKIIGSFSDTTVEQENSTAFIPSTLFEDGVYGYKTYQFKAENTFEKKTASYKNYLTVGIQGSEQTRLAETAVTGGHTFHPEGKSQLIGGYLQNEFIWKDKLTLIPGIRVDYQKLSPGDQISGNLQETADFNAVSPKLAAHYKFNNHFAVFGSYAHTERMPVLDEIFDAASGNFNIAPEISDNVEAGIALSYDNLIKNSDAFRVKVTLYNNDVKNLISRETQVSPYTNTDKARLYGLELEGSYQSDSVFAKFAYTRARGRDEDADVWLNSVPADQLNVTLGGYLPQYDVSFGWKGTFAAGQDKVSGTISATDGYAVHGLFASWKPDSHEFKGLEARVTVDNLFDRDYKEHLAGDPGTGRTIKFTLSKQFGG